MKMEKHNVWWKQVAEAWNEEEVKPLNSNPVAEAEEEEEEESEYLPDVLGFVNVYSVTRHYGGPEEGGWYYNWYTCLESFPCRYKNQHEVVEYLESEHGMKRFGNIYSVLGGKEIYITWEESPKESESTERPYYE
jgi:hypothetical protein